MKSSITIGMDMGDQSHHVCVLDGEGNMIRSETIPNTSQAVTRFFEPYAGALVAIEAGTHSGWVSRILERLGCIVLIGNPRKLKAIWMSTHKSDVRDAEMLARIARFDPKLLYPIHHRGEAAQIALKTIKARDRLVQARSDLINHVRAVVKGIGGRIPAGSTEAFHHRAEPALPEGLRAALMPLVTIIGELTTTIRGFDKAIEDLSTEPFPETARLRQVTGVGPVTALAYVLTLEEPDRFAKSRAVPRFDATAGPIGTDRQAIKDPQSGQRISAPSAGRLLALHLGPLWPRLRPAPVWDADRGAGRKERQAAGRRGGSSQAGGFVAPAVGQWRHV